MSERERRRRCAWVQERLPTLVDGTMARWRQRLVHRHLARCGACTTEVARQRVVAEGLRDLGGQATEGEPGPPDELLDAILERVNEPGLRERVAVPARGAVSGARPELSAAAIAVLVLLGYALWRALRWARGSRTGRGSSARNTFARPGT